LAAGREKASTMFNKLYADMEALREAQRKRAEEQGPEQTAQQQHQHTVGTKAGAFVSGWAAWAGEKRKAAGWGRGSSGSSQTTPTTSSGSGAGGGGWTSGWGKTRHNSHRASQASGTSETLLEKESASSSERGRSLEGKRGSTAGGEALFDAAASSPKRRPVSGGEEMKKAPDGVTVVAAPVIAVDKAASGARLEGEVKEAGVNGTAAAAAAATPTPTAEKEKEKPTIKPVAAAEVEVETPPLTPTPVAAATAEAKAAQDVWGRRNWGGTTWNE
jgi:hypothetical protein